MKKYFLCFVLLLSSSAYAVPAETHFITGPGIDLRLKYKAMTGLIDDHPFFAVFDIDKHEAELWVRPSELKTIHGVYSLKDGQVNGLMDAAGSEPIAIENINPVEHSLTYQLGKETVTVQIASKKFTADRFDDPDYSARLHGEDIHFHFSGNTCYNCSSFIALVILEAKSLALDKAK